MRLNIYCLNYIVFSFYQLQVSMYPMFLNLVLKCKYTPAEKTDQYGFITVCNITASWARAHKSRKPSITQQPRFL